MNAPASRPPQPGQTSASASAQHPLRPWLSALADGDVAAVEQACEAWRHDAQSRADWHTYHLIGDVLRSDDLAGDPARDARFLARLRLRLADEPVPLAPVAAVTPSRRRRAVWLMPVAAAAGVAAVAGVLVLGLADPQGAAPAGGWALGNPPVAAPGLLARDGPADRQAETNAAGTGNANARVLRNARLDHYLEAHRGALGAAVAVPGGAMRNAEVIVPAPEQR